MKYKVRFVLLPAIKELQRATGVQLTDQAYADAIGISRPTFTALMAGKSRATKNETIEKVLEFFHNQSYPIPITKLYEVVMIKT